MKVIFVHSRNVHHHSRVCWIFLIVFCSQTGVMICLSSNPSSNTLGKSLSPLLNLQCYNFVIIFCTRKQLPDILMIRVLGSHRRGAHSCWLLGQGLRSQNIYKALKFASPGLSKWWLWTSHSLIKLIKVWDLGKSYLRAQISWVSQTFAWCSFPFFTLNLY